MSSSKTNRILILGINYAPELTGIGKYTGEMAGWLADNGYECTVVTGFPYYPQWDIQPPYTGRAYKKETQKDGKINIYRSPLYVPKNPTGMKRILHDASFFMSAYFVMLYLLFKPANDYIFCIAPPFHLGFLARFYRFFKGGKLVYHVQDLQIDAAANLGIVKSRALINLLLKLERSILKSADVVTTISEGMVRKIAQKVNKPVHLFPNWVDTDTFCPIEKDAIDRAKYGFSSDDKIVMYSGSIGEKQGIEAIIEAAKHFEGVPEYKFVISGAGPYKEKLEKLSNDLALKNVHFFPLQPAESFNEFSNLADVHLVLQKSTASDLVMPSKLAGILAIGGLALITADPGSGLYDEIEKHQIGLLVPAENPDALIDGIKNAILYDHSLIRKYARNYAEHYLSPGRILPAFEKLLDPEKGHIFRS